MNHLPNAEEVYLHYITEYNNSDLETLLSAYREGLYFFLLSFVKNEEDAEELLMDTFAKLAVDRPRFIPGREGSFKSWLYAIARNNALMHIRRRKMEAVPLEEDTAAAADTPESCLIRDERKRLIYNGLKALKPEYRRALTLLYIEGFSHDEIALAMGVKKKQVYNYLERGKAALKDRLLKMGMTGEEII